LSHETTQVTVKIFIWLGEFLTQETKVRLRLLVVDLQQDWYLAFGACAQETRTIRDLH
jgi:hypothetical protein